MTGAQPVDQADEGAVVAVPVRVRRRLLPWRLRLRGGRLSRAGTHLLEASGDVGEFLEVPVVGLVVAPVMVALLAIGAALAGPFLVVLLVELALLLALFPVVVLWRAARAEPWPLDATTADGLVVAVWWADGWRDARRWARHFQAELAAGDPDLPASGARLTGAPPTPAP